MIKEKTCRVKEIKFLARGEVYLEGGRYAYTSTICYIAKECSVEATCTVTIDIRHGTELGKLLFFTLVHACTLLYRLT